MDRVVNLVGPSGSGKTAIAKELEKRGFNIIQSYTGRKPRHENEWGHTFISDVATHGKYITWKDVMTGERGSCITDDVIAFFNNYTKSEVYFATRQQYRGKGTSIYIVDPRGAEQVRKNVKDAEVITILLSVDRMRRQERIFNRAIGESNKGRNEALQEVMMRVTKDDKIFSACNCDYVVSNNHDMGEAVEHICSILGK